MFPRGMGVRNYCWRVLMNSFIRISSRDLRGACGPQRAAAADLWNRREIVVGRGELVLHSRVHASQGSLPAVSPWKYDQSRLATKTKMPAP